MAICNCMVYSQVLESDINILICIPSPKGTEEEGATLEQIYARPQPYKTLYLLHGMHGNATSWLRKTNIERYADAHGLAVVMPSAQNSFYTNMNHGLSYDTFIAQELPLMMRALFPLSDARADNFIAGLSMGGYGACKLALQHPEQYAAFATLSGAVDIVEIAAQAEVTPFRRTYEDVFGPCECARDSENNLFVIAQRAKASGVPLPCAYIACGLQDELCLGMNVKLREHFTALGIPFTYEEGPGAHEWDFWDTYIRRVLDWLPI